MPIKLIFKRLWAQIHAGIEVGRTDGVRRVKENGVYYD